MSGRSHQGSDNNEKQQNHTVLVINPHCAGNKKRSDNNVKQQK